MSTIPDSVHAKIADLLEMAPVPIDQVARRLGLEIYKRDLGHGVSGALLKDVSYGTPSQFVIFVDDSEPFVRQRFTAAHEMGHYILHKALIGDGIEDNYLLRTSGLSNSLETEANKFAADVLMPFPLVQRLIAAGKDDVSSLARALQVSEIAMGIRLGHPT